MENPLLALPLLLDENQSRFDLEIPEGATGVIERQSNDYPINEMDVLDRLQKLSAFLKQASGLANDRGKDLICQYAHYGGYRTVFAECTVPLDRSFIVTLKEKRPFAFGRIRHGGLIDPERPNHFTTKVRFLVPFKEAKTSHITVHIPDMNVALKKGSWKLRDERNRYYIKVENASERKSTEILALYSGNYKRGAAVWLGFKLRQTASIRLTLGVIWFALAATILTLLALNMDGMWTRWTGRHSTSIAMAGMVGCFSPHLLLHHFS